MFESIFVLMLLSFSYIISYWIFIMQHCWSWKRAWSIFVEQGGKEKLFGRLLHHAILWKFLLKTSNMTIHLAYFTLHSEIIFRSWRDGKEVQAENLSCPHHTKVRIPSRGWLAIWRWRKALRQLEMV